MPTVRVRFIRLVRSTPWRDPTTFVGAFALWAVICGCQLVLPGSGNLIAPVYKYVHAIGWPQWVWGWLMLSDGLLLLWSLMCVNYTMRARIALCSGVMWVFLGTLMLFAGADLGILSAVGAWNVVGSLGLWAAAVQWVTTGDG